MAAGVSMRCRCEVAVQDILPIARSLLAKKLLDAYGMSQTEAAKKMGVSQPAISQYKKDIRGCKKGSLADSPKFTHAVNDIAKRLADGSVTARQMPSELCRLCRAVQG
jgi:predicted transcriptional regulator